MAIIDQTFNHFDHFTQTISQSMEKDGNFRTTFPLGPMGNNITLKDKVFTIGSCFSDNIGNKLLENKFQVMANPYGVIFNPISIFQLLSFSLGKTSFPPEHAFAKDNTLFHFNFHSSVNAGSAPALLQKTIGLKEGAGVFLNRAKTLIITFGTAFTYTYRQTGEVVANCHKIPAEKFEKRLLQPAEIVQGFQSLTKILPPNIQQIILTVSPIRHIKDTIPLNCVSKSVLRVACHEITECFPGLAHYFPAYELLMDDLRDYRFYGEDMLHPSEQAIDYIWGKFCISFFDQEIQGFIKEWGKIRKGLHHRPFDQNSPKHLDFLQQLLQKIEKLKNDFSTIDLSREISALNQQIKESGGVN